LPIQRLPLTFLSAAVVVLLIANIRNAWDITLVMARRRSGSQ
jgi:hypothetical protein